MGIGKEKRMDMEQTAALENVLADAARTAVYMGHRFIDTEHVLIAMAGSDDTMARRMLRRDQTPQTMIARARTVLNDVPVVTGTTENDDDTMIDIADVGNDE